jgi:hypothetical protein
MYIKDIVAYMCMYILVSKRSVPGECDVRVNMFDRFGGKIQREFGGRIPWK